MGYCCSECHLYILIIIASGYLIDCLEIFLEDHTTTASEHLAIYCLTYDVISRNLLLLP